MSRRWIALTSGLVVSTLFVTMASGQASKPPASLADRMSALRRGWSQGQTQSNANAAANSGGMELQSNGPPQSESRSMWPNIFGRRNERPAAQANGNATPNRIQGQTNSARRTSPQSQRTGDTPLVPRTATRPRAGSVQSSTPRASSATLPGLGGSPLPRSEAASTPAKPSGGPDISQEITSDYPGLRNNTSTSTTRSDTVRQSPHRRTASHIDPDQLRRELSGTFPMSENGTGDTPRTARADKTGPTEKSNDMSDAEFGESARSESTSATGLTLPSDDGAPFRISDSTEASHSENKPESATITDNSTTTSPAKIDRIEP